MSSKMTQNKSRFTHLYLKKKKVSISFVTTAYGEVRVRVTLTLTLTLWWYVNRLYRSISYMASSGGNIGWIWKTKCWSPCKTSLQTTMVTKWMDGNFRILLSPNVIITPYKEKKVLFLPIPNVAFQPRPFHTFCWTFLDLFETLRF